VNDIYDEGNSEQWTYSYRLQRYVDDQWWTVARSNLFEEVHAKAQDFEEYHKYISAPWRILTTREITSVYTSLTDQDHPPLDNAVEAV
jgi:hypothetical protein